MPIKGYYTRAKVFGYLLLAMSVFAMLYYLFQDFLN